MHNALFCWSLCTNAFAIRYQNHFHSLCLNSTADICSIIHAFYEGLRAICRWKWQQYYRETMWHLKRCWHVSRLTLLYAWQFHVDLGVKPSPFAVLKFIIWPLTAVDYMSTMFSSTWLLSLEVVGGVFLHTLQNKLPRHLPKTSMARSLSNPSENRCIKCNMPATG